MLLIEQFRSRPLVSGHGGRDLVGGYNLFHDVSDRDLPGECGAQTLWQRLLVGQRELLHRERVHCVGNEPAAEHVHRHVLRGELVPDQLGHSAHSPGILLSDFLQHQRHQHGAHLQKADLQYAFNCILPLNVVFYIEHKPTTGI